MKLRFLQLFCIVFALHTRAPAQEIRSTHFSTEEGLPSPETYFTYQDTLGYIWIGTDHGLCRFDGDRFKVFDQDNSILTNNTVLDVYPAPDGSLWFSCYDGSITIYHPVRQTFEQFQFNDSLAKWYNSILRNIVFDGTNVKLYSHNRKFRDELVLVNLKESRIRREKILLNHLDSIPLPAFVLQDYPRHRFHTVYSDQDRKGREVWYRYGVGNPNLLRDGYLSVGDGSTIYFPLFHTLYRWNGTEVSKVHNFRDSEEITFLFKDHRNRIFVLTPLGCYLLTDEGMRRLMSGRFNHMMQDREFNYWIATGDDGLLLVPDIQTEDYNAVMEGRKIRSITDLDGYLFFGTDREEIWCLTKENKSPRLVINDYTGQRAQMIITPLKKKRGELTAPGDLRIWVEGGKIRTRKFFTWHSELTSTSTINLLLRDGRLLSGGLPPLGGYTLYDEPGSKKYSRYDLLDGERVTDFYEDEKRHLRISTLQGVWCVPPEHPDEPQKTQFHQLKGRVNQVLQNGNGVLAFATEQYGVVLVKGSDTMSLSAQSHLGTSAVNCIAFENDSVLWAGTNRGIYRVWVSAILDKSHVHYSLNTDDGLLSNFVYALHVWDDRLWLGLDNRLQSLDLLSIAPREVRPKIILAAVHLRGEKQVDSKQAEFNHDQNSLTVSFTGISFKKPREKFYKYRLLVGDKPDEKGFNYTNNNQVDLFNLAPGEYVFEVSCRDKNDHWSEVKSYAFAINPHFTQTLWFRISAYVLGLGVVLLFVFWRNRETAQKNRRETQLRELELRFKESELAILRNQMNPHFVFNALNSIQSYVLDNDIATASGYIQKFSVLMRSSLEYSMDDWITLTKEINFLTNYLQIERLRFPERFDFEVIVSEEIDPEEVLIPPLLIQPIVENCVKHAFKPDSKNGKILIRFELRENGLLCVVEDNGVGVNQSRKKMKANHTSYGTEVVRNRLKLLATEEYEPTVTITDRSTLDENTSGTRVEILLPEE